jgi:hypothetical protein
MKNRIALIRYDVDFMFPPFSNMIWDERHRPSMNGRQENAIIGDSQTTFRLASLSVVCIPDQTSGGARIDLTMQA